NRQSVWRRFFIVVSGPVFNFIFAVLVYAALFMYGLPEARPVIGMPPAGTSAAAAGLTAGDTVRAVDGEAIGTWQELRWRVLQAGTPLARTVQRDGAERSVEVVPDAVGAGNARLGRIGAGPYQPPAYAEKMLIRVQHGPLASLARASGKTSDIALFSLKMLGRMLLGEISWRHLSGPVTIADFAGQSAQMGWVSYLTFLALISISLGVLNLL